MSVFHCFEDAFSFLPGGKNLMFQGGIWFLVSGFWFQASAYFLPLRQGAKRVFRGMTECHSVPSEESTPQCDVGQTRRGRGYDVFPSLL